MNIVEKIRILSDAAKFDTCASSASKRRFNMTASKSGESIGNAAAAGICHSYTADGRCVSLFKTLQTNTCKFDCKYCSNSSCSKSKNKATFEPEQLSKLFMQLYVRNYVEGLFLSSGIAKDPDSTSEKMIETVKLLRRKYKFNGYIHFKIIPGTNKDLIKQAAEMSDRMSVNLEAPNKSRLSEISSVKDFNIDIIRRQLWIKKMTDLSAGQTTQLVVGANGETDHEILSSINWEYRNTDLKRGYYSAFSPVKNTPFENNPKAPLLREHRLYNVDFMMRLYKIKLNEFKSIMNDGMLPTTDPKEALAKEYFDSPVEINDASEEELIRIPGIGPLSLKRIKDLQKKNKIIKDKKMLNNIGVRVNKALPFIKINGSFQRTLSSFA